MNVKSIEIVRGELREIDREIITLEAQVKQKRKERQNLVKAIEVLQKKSKSLLEIPESYNKDLSWKEKIAFALRNRKGSNVEQITDEIIELEPKLKKGSTYTTIQRNLIRMVNEGYIIKKGKYKSTYELNSHQK